MSYWEGESGCKLCVARPNDKTRKHKLIAVTIIILSFGNKPLLPRNVIYALPTQRETFSREQTDQKLGVINKTAYE